MSPQTLLELECVAIKGASVVSQISQNALSEQWEQSSVIPFGASSETTSFPSA